jgi:ABC-type transporter Mla subunit MlaD
MRRIALIIALIAAAAATVATVAGADGKRTYQVELDNAFGLVPGSDVKIGGVVSGSITDLDVNDAKRAVVTVEVSGPFSELKKDATCSSEPQSLIAEFFLDCQQGQAPEPLTGVLPVEQTTQTVQQDLVNNILREPYKRRFQLIINEFGTALAGNPENLNEAIRRGAPALRNLDKVLEILARQNRVIRDLNVNSDTVIGRLAENRANVARFIEEANDTAAASASRRADLARDFELLPGFLGELHPSLVQLDKLVREQTPILSDLRRSSGQLTTLSNNLPGFNNATRISLLSLGEASKVGKRAFTKAADEIAELDKASTNAPGAAKPTADFLAALDQPERYVEEDTRATDDTGRPQPAGYTGLEGLLNYVYYQTTAINQFDTIGHLLHVVLLLDPANPCFNFNTGGTGQDVPARTGGRTHDANQVHECVSWLGPNQPQLNQTVEGVTPYSSQVCNLNTEPVHAGNLFGRPDPLCDPASPFSAQSSKASSASNQAALDTNALKDLGLPTNLLDQILGGKRRRSGQAQTQTYGMNPGAANDLLRFLFGP